MGVINKYKVELKNSTDYTLRLEEIQSQIQKIIPRLSSYWNFEAEIDTISYLKLIKSLNHFGIFDIKFTTEIMYSYDHNGEMSSSEYYFTTVKTDILKYLYTNSTFLQTGHYNLFARFDLTDDPIPREKCGEGCCGELGVIIENKQIDLILKIRQSCGMDAIESLIDFFENLFVSKITFDSEE